MEGVPGVAAVGDGIGQRREQVEELEHRARPAVGEDQRHRLGLRRAQVDEVDLEPVDLGA